SFAGYLALRIAGPGRGYGIAGLLGGLVSSTAVTLNFARESREHAAHATALGAGALAASTILPLRVLVVSAVLNLEVALALAPALAPLLLLSVAAVLWAWHRSGTASAEAGLLPRNPLRLGAAIQMAV